MPDHQPAFPNGPPAWPRVIAGMADVFQDLLNSGDWGKYHASHTEKLAPRISQLVGQQETRLTSSGTIAVELALRGVGVGRCDEVILGAYDFPGNFRCIESCGAIPVLVDMDAVTGCLDAAALDSATTAQTKAILVSHLHGGIAAMRSICRLAHEKEIAVIEDACQSPGARVDGQPAGSWGDVSTLSFGGSKLLTAGRGGSVSTKHPEVMQRIRIYADRGNDSFPLSQMQAAVISCQLDYLEPWNQQRRESAMMLRHRLADVSRICYIGQSLDDATKPSYYKTMFLLDESIDRASWIANVQREGVAIDAGFRGFAKRSQRRCRKIGKLTVSQRIATQGVVLHHPVLLENETAICKLASVMQIVTENA